MAQAQIRSHVSGQEQCVRVEKTQRRRLDRPAEEERAVLQGLRQIGDNRVADALARGAVEHQPERPLRVVLADEDDRVLEERAAQLPTVEEQLPFQEFVLLRHIAKTISSLPRSQSGLNFPYVKTLSASSLG